MQPVAHGFFFASSLAFGCLVVLSPTRAQIVPDNTLPVNSTVTPGCTICTIKGGTVRGTNLFHSFQSFSVLTGGEAFFNNAQQIQNILTRVTGNSVSSIDGRLRANGTANLFLLNPNGIIFGTGARLDIGGSFVASTASSLVFADGTVFSTAPASPTTPLLTITAPLGLQYGRNAGSIQVQGATLDVGLGQTLALVGGDVQLNDGLLYTPFQPPGGRVELGGLAGEGTIGLSNDGSYLSLSFPDGVARGDVSLTNGARVDVVAGGGGSIAINARSLTMTGETTQLRAGIASGWGSVDAVAGDIDINATEAISLDGSLIFNWVQGGGVGKGGEINITTSQLRVSNGASVDASTFGSGDAGDLTVRATDSIEVTGSDPEGYASKISAQVYSQAQGNGGNLTLDTGQLLLSQGGQVGVSTFGTGNGGQLQVTATEVDVVGDNPIDGLPSGLFASVGSDATGRGGNVKLNTSGLRVREGAYISASTSGFGDAGDLTVRATDSIEVSGSDPEGGASNINAQVTPQAEGNGGNLTLDTGQLLINQGGQISVSTFGTGNGGQLQVTATEVDVVGDNPIDGSPSGLFANVDSDATGRGGNVKLNTSGLRVREGAYISASTSGFGDAGDLTVRATDSIEVSGSDPEGYASNISAQVNSQAQGNGGNLTLDTGQLLINQGGQISVSTFGTGDGGELQVTATEIDVVGDNPISGNPSGVFSRVGQTGIGKGGDINITAGSVSVADGAQVLTRNEGGRGNAGRVTITASDTVSLAAFDGNGDATIGSDVADGGIGNGNDINITARSVFLQDDAVLAASIINGRGENGTPAQAGDVNIKASDTISLNSGGRVYSEVGSRSVGNGGTINITAPSVSLEDYALLQTRTRGQGNAGSVIIEADNRVSLNNSYIRSDVDEGANGNGGDINITTGSLNVTNRSELNARSIGQGNAGDLNITANFVLLDKKGRLIAETASGEGGNIKLQVSDLLLMRNNSLISAQAFNNGNGGNVNIDARLIVAIPSEDSDIVADADRGNGGRIDITTSGIFGLEFRNQRTRQSDITASSKFGISGTVNINKLDVDPSQGLAALPTTLVDRTNEIDQGCSAGRTNQENQFIITGRSGLPQSPNEMLAPEMVLDDLGTPVERNSHSRESVEPSVTSPSKQLVEAQGWIIDRNGKVTLVAQAPSATPSSPALTPASCQKTQN